MKVIFKEIINGNLPKKEKEEFSVEEGEKYYFVYKNGKPSRDQIMKFNKLDADSEVEEERCKMIFRRCGHRLNEETKEWGK